MFPETSANSAQNERKFPQKSANERKLNLCTEWNSAVGAPRAFFKWCSHGRLCNIVHMRLLGISLGLCDLDQVCVIMSLLRTTSCATLVQGVASVGSLVPVPGTNMDPKELRAQIEASLAARIAIECCAT